jgi:hypothetical protein
MLHMRLLLLGVVALLVVGAVASSSASAIGHVGACEVASVAGGGQWGNAECTELGGSKEFETKEVTSGELKGTGGEAVLESEIAGAKISVICAKGKTTGEIEAAGAAKGEATFEECTVGNSSERFVNCEVPNIKVKAKSQVIEEESQLREEFKPNEEVEGKKIFGTIIIKNKGEKVCAQKSSGLRVEGFAIALLPTAGLRLGLLFDFSLADNHHLTLGGKPASLTTSITYYLLRSTRLGSRFVPWHIYR